MMKRRDGVKAGLATAALLLGRAGQAAAQANREAVSILVRNDSVGFDPHKVTGRGAAEILFMITDTLVALEDDQKTVHPLLAKSWTISPDGLTYIFELRDDVTFHSGRKMVADDVVFSLNRLVDPATRSPAAWRAGAVKSIRATGPFTVEYILERPYNELLLQLAQSFGAIIDREEVTALGAEYGSRTLNGTGPFRWGEWRPRDRVVLNRHEAYRWGPAIYENRGPALVRQVIWQVVPEESTIVASTMTGGGDITYVAPEWAVDQLRRNPRLTVQEPRVSNYSAFLGLRTNREFTSDVRVRQAMSLCINREELVRTLWFGQAGVGWSYINPGTLDFSEAGRVRFDRAAADVLLDQAGWVRGGDGIRVKDGKRLSPEIIAANTPGWRSRLGAIQGYMRNVGIELRLLMPEPAAAMAQINSSPNYDAYALFQPYGTAGEALMPFHSRNIPAPNRTQWRDQRTDDLLNAGQVALNEADRADAYGKVQGIVADNAVVIPIAHEKLFLFVNQRIAGAKVHGIYNCGVYKGLDLRIAR
ncbi:ABC transporter substrate-binding protein [Roseomonas sp. CAU 1739]|uniref:ABC transporter substrate-binding protein n=1 Tax=Roseomonas sp. CAU 1739 TaxID=3140364 RepID=UPI00325C1934